MRIPFWKVESIGNDFVLVHLDEVERLRGPETADHFLKRFAIKASERRFGIGSDGLLALGLQSDNSILQRMFNPDGTEDFCGNGIRCGFDHALRHGWLKIDEEMRMHHLGRLILGVGRKSCAPLCKGAFSIDFELPPASYAPKDIPLDRTTELFDAEITDVAGKVYSGSVLSTGTAHTILPAEELPGDEEFFRVSPLIEHDALFPERTSVMWVRTESEFEITMRVWERGAGETLGCGTGSVAAAIDSLRRKQIGGEVRVHNPGGTLSVFAESWDSPPTVRGYAQEIFQGEFPI